mmetsp:Transcript_19416/g.28776  ORF Transcript_19416/g.28776 Transcript_19416/m.28776 type:complete len:410 (-) Transcript_19416:1103-2332(-)|eukprot:CAMPEP_0194216032 /NCGR_PEP_ID=MMETSP0156-20130528/18221_1 /TAXON_ID=33649 /ORGANISM="Thalassionema nitzschioides, Strain L26-B" /LENGTH=409 /DNA_ID=CAMNT_0038944697 /DNA_START=51 /DNA_END=1280 /DNA_ORIENTATION=+
MTARVDPKIIDLLKEKKDKPHASLEYFPPRTEEGVKNLYARMDRMKENVAPLFTDVTWGAGGSTADLSMEIALTMHSKGHVANLHMTCTNMAGVDDPKKGIKSALQQALDGGIRNIVALRGDPPAGENEWKAAEGGFTCALDLVKFIRAEFGSEFGISVAGYPEGHPNAISKVDDPNTMSEAEKGRSSTDEDGVVYTCKDEDYKKEMAYLKEKVDAGADFIITQMFFDTKVFIQFVKDCRTYGITCPVVPGLMCLNAYAGFRKMTKFCKTRVPEDLDTDIEKVDKDDKDAMKVFGVEYGAKMCRELVEFLDTDVAPYALHFYTLNLEKVVYGILEMIGIMEKQVEADEADALTMAAVGSAWARVGDTVKCATGTGVVTEMDQSTGTATIKLNDSDTIVKCQKSEYEKVF